MITLIVSKSKEKPLTIQTFKIAINYSVANDLPSISLLVLTLCRAQHEMQSSLVLIVVVYHTI